MSSTRLVVCSRVSPPDKFSANRLSAQLRVRKGIPRTRPSLFWCRPYDHPENIQVRSVNLLGSHISLLDAEARFLGLSGVYRVDLPMPIGAAVVVMAIEAVLLIQTVIAIVAVLLIQTVINIVAVLAVKAVRAIKPVMAIKTIMDIKTNMHFSGIEPGIECKELIPG